MFSKKKTECRVCGYRFTPERENIYTAEEPRSALEMLTAAPTRFSAVDCPICGCQIRLADRAPRICNARFAKAKTVMRGYMRTNRTRNISYIARSAALKRRTPSPARRRR